MPSEDSRPEAAAADSQPSAPTHSELIRYVDWTDADAERVNAVAAVLMAFSEEIVGDFYATITRFPEAMAVMTGGAAQIARLKSTLQVWMRQLLEGPYDEQYVELRAKVGRRHVMVGLDHQYANAALCRMRSSLQRVLNDHWSGTPARLAATLISLNKRIDLDSAIIAEAYHEEYLRQQQSLTRQNLQLRTALNQSQSHGTMVGESPAMKAVYRLIERAGPTGKPILIQGETGAGKELVARALHAAGPQNDQPLVAINCAALPEALLESELFGHEKGAFTGATVNKPGLFEIADGGTLFIDEIGELAGGLQAKLLRVLEDGVLRRVGSVNERQVSVRLIAATNRDLDQEIAAGRFREDLYYRVNVLKITLPPLRDRPGDVRLLVEHLVGEGWQWTPEFMAVLENYGWPGNVRQLQNALDRAKILAEDDVLEIEGLPSEIVRASKEKAIDSLNDAGNLDAINRRHVTETLARCEGNKSRTARALGVSRRALYRLLEKYDIDEPRS